MRTPPCMRAQTTPRIDFTDSHHPINQITHHLTHSATSWSPSSGRCRSPSPRGCPRPRCATASRRRAPRSAPSSTVSGRPLDWMHGYRVEIQPIFGLASLTRISPPTPQPPNSNYSHEGGRADGLQQAAREGAEVHPGGARRGVHGLHREAGLRQAGPGDGSHGAVSGAFVSSGRGLIGAAAGGRGLELWGVVGGVGDGSI